MQGSCIPNICASALSVLNLPFFLHLPDFSLIVSQWILTLDQKESDALWGPFNFNNHKKSLLINRQQRHLKIYTAIKMKNNLLKSLVESKNE